MRYVTLASDTMKHLLAEQISNDKHGWAF